MKTRQKPAFTINSFAWLFSVAFILFMAVMPGATATLANPIRPLPSLSGFPRVGIETQDYQPAVFNGISGTNAKYVRVQLSWRQIEPSNTTPPNFNWATYDLMFSQVISAGITPMVTVLDCPPWACLRDNGPMYDSMYGEAAQFMGALAARYSTPQYNVHYWELWNEPDASGGPTPGDHSWGWGNFPDKYALMLQNVYPAIKAADPQAVVITGGLAYSNFWSEGGPFNPDFMLAVIAHGARPYLDAIAYHYYSHDPHYVNVGTKADTLRAAIGSEAQNIPFICTEAGLTSDPNFGSSDQIQARYVVKLYSWAAAHDVQSIAWYLYQDYTYPDPSQEIFTKSGIVRLDGSQKPSYRSMQVLAEKIGSAPYSRALGPADGLTSALEGYKFRTPPGTDFARYTWTVWSNTGVTDTLTIPAAQAPTVMRATGLYGNPVTITTGSSNTLLVSVGPDPVYIDTNSNPPRFSDVPYLYWAYDYVEYLAANGIVGGYSDGTFRPGNPATRGQFAKMDTLGMGWALLNPPTATFSDAPTDSPFYQYIETAYSHGVINGYPCGGPGEPCDPQNRPYFRPGNNITRAQIAKIIVGSKGWILLDPIEPTFTDIPFGSTFYQWIETAVSKGIIAGYPCGGPGEPCDAQNRPYFRPNNNATRAQLSKMLALALQQ